jgi:hypothetical protein
MTKVYDLESLMKEEFEEDDEFDQSFVFETEDEQDEKLRKTLVPEGYQVVHKNIEPCKELEDLLKDKIEDDEENDQDYQQEEEEEEDDEIEEEEMDEVEKSEN